jgi:hypothetical protein
MPFYSLLIQNIGIHLHQIDKKYEDLDHDDSDCFVCMKYDPELFLEHSLEWILQSKRLFVSNGYKEQMDLLKIEWGYENV